MTLELSEHSTFALFCFINKKTRKIWTFNIVFAYDRLIEVTINWAIQYDYHRSISA